MPKASNVYKEVKAKKYTTPKESNNILHTISNKDLTLLGSINA
jgi:hypothetical protein